MLVFHRIRFWHWCIAASAVGLVHPVAVWIKLGMPEAATVIKNDPSFNVFLPFVFPFAVALIATSVLPDLFRKTSIEIRRASAILLALLIGVVVGFGVWGDFARHEVTPPQYLRDHRDAIARDEQLRRPLRTMLGIASDKELHAAAADAVTAYATTHRPIKTLADLRARGGAIAALKLVLNASVAIVLAVFFGAIVLMGSALIAERTIARINMDRWVLAFSLLVLWFPMRLYSEWYENFFSLDSIRTYSGFWILVGLGLVAIGWMVYMMKPSRSSLTIPALLSAFSVVFGVIGALKPSLLLYAAVIFLKMESEYLVIIAFAIGLCAASVAAAVSTRRRARRASSMPPPPAVQVP